ncbi:MAG: hypothetical protein ABW051_09730 [Burkholderiaceae bacterium]
MTPQQLVLLVWTHLDEFIPEFWTYLPDNAHVYYAFEWEALRIIGAGYDHYSANTIIEVLRHHSALAQVGDRYKLNAKYTCYLARLFALVHPEHEGLFEYRVTRADRIAGRA